MGPTIPQASYKSFTTFETAFCLFMALTAVHAVLHMVMAAFGNPAAAAAAAFCPAVYVCQAYECRSIEQQREIISQLYDEGAV
jgi:hypothetical protein